MGDIKTRFTLEGEQQFKSAMSNAANAIKVLNSEQKLAKAQFQNTGNAQKYAAQQADILKKKIEQQKTAVKAAEDALKALSNKGVAENSRQFQQWQTKLNNAQTALTQMETELKDVNKSMEETSVAAGDASAAISTIGTKVSFDAIVSGVNSVTGAMETAAKAALNFGKKIGESILEGASWADDLLTNSLVYQIDQEKLQKMMQVADFIDTPVEAIVKAQRKTKNAVADMSADTQAVLRDLKIGIREGGNYWQNNYKSTLAMRDAEDIFWDVGEAIYALDDAFKQEDYAQKIFGRNWSELIPLFEKGRAEYDRLMDEQEVVSEENVQKLAELDDQFQKLQNQWENTKRTLEAALAPALTELGKVLSGLMEEFNKYLESEKGQEMLERLGSAVTDLFSDLAEIDPDEVVSGVVKVFEGITGTLEWIKDNQGAVVTALKAIVGVWATGKVVSGASTILNMLNGFKGLGIGGSAAAAAKSAGAAVGTSWISGFTSAVVSAAPVVASLLGITAVSITPAVFAQKNDEKKWIEDQNRREMAAAIAEEIDPENAAFIRKAAAAIGPKKNADGSYQTDFTGLFLNMNPTDSAYDLLMGLKAYQNQQRAELFNIIRKYSPETVTQNGAGYTIDELLKFWNGEEFDYASIENLLTSITDALAQHAENKVQIPSELKIPEDSAQIISDTIGAIPVKVVPFIGNSRISGKFGNSYNSSSNLYVENMNMNNGQDVEGLAAEIAAANRQTMRGFG